MKVGLKEKGKENEKGRGKEGEAYLEGQPRAWRPDNAIFDSSKLQQGQDGGDEGGAEGGRERGRGAGKAEICGEEEDFFRGHVGGENFGRILVDISREGGTEGGREDDAVVQNGARDGAMPGFAAGKDVEEGCFTRARGPH